MAAKFKYRAFISYSHKDESWAGWLHKALETYHFPKRLVGRKTTRGTVPRRLGKVFRDRDELASSASLSDELMQALAASEFLIVICSPNSAVSHWVNEEILAFKRLGREQHILSLIVAGEPHASERPATIRDECFPPALRYRLNDDGQLSSVRSEPVAADVRRKADSKQTAKLRLIASIAGVDFDALRQREAQRKQRRMLAITAASVSGMIFACGLAAYAWQQRDEARVQTVRAEQEAEVARETRDFLVGLFEVADPSAARGETITAKEILDKGAARIEVDLAGQPAIQATLMDTIGTVYTSLGLYDSASAMLTGALQTREAIPGIDIDTVLTFERFATLLTLDAQYERAEAVFQRALMAASELPVSTDALTARIRSRLADLYKRMGDYDAAQPLFREALEVQKALLDDDSPDLAQTIEGLAMNLYHQGDYEAPVGLLEEAVAMRRRIHDGPHPELAEALNNLGLVLNESGRYLRAESLYREALAMKRQLFGNLHPEVAIGINNVALVLNNRGEHAAATQMYAEAIEIQRQRLGPDHPDVALALNNLAFALYDQGDLDAALAMSRESLATYRRGLGNEHSSVARSMANLGMWLTTTGDLEEAEAVLRESLRLRSKIHGNGHTDVAASMTLLANTLVARGNFDEALELAKRAHEIFAHVLREGHWRTAVAANAEGAALAGLERFSEAEYLLLRSLNTLKSDAGTLHIFVAMAERRVVDLYREWGKPELAARHAVRLSD